MGPKLATVPFFLKKCHIQNIQNAGHALDLAGTPTTQKQRLPRKEQPYIEKSTYGEHMGENKKQGTRGNSNAGS